MAIGAQPCACRRGVTPSAFSAIAIRVKPWPSAQRAKIRHTTAAWSGFTRRTTWEPPAVGARDLDVVVAVDLPSGDVKRACLARERVVRPLAGLLALELG